MLITYCENIIKKQTLEKLVFTLSVFYTCIYSERKWEISRERERERENGRMRSDSQYLIMQGDEAFYMLSLNLPLLINKCELIEGSCIISND